MMRVQVDGCGLIGPGLPGWQVARDYLAGKTAAPGGELTLPKLDLLPPVERRRAGLQVKLAFAAAQDALAGTPWPASGLATIFTASGADGDVVNEICAMLAGPDRQISPTRFHNSVHNAAAGYWSIATGAREPSTSLCAYDWSFAAGLLEAACQLGSGHDRLLLIACDIPYPPPLLNARPVTRPFGTALLLSRPGTSQGIASLDIELRRANGSATRMQDPLLEFLRQDNPSARALPLLAVLARKAPQEVVLDYLEGALFTVTAAPC